MARERTPGEPTYSYRKSICPAYKGERASKARARAKQVEERSKLAHCSDGKTRHHMTPVPSFTTLPAGCWCYMLECAWCGYIEYPVMACPLHSDSVHNA